MAVYGHVWECRLCLQEEIRKCSFSSWVWFGWCEKQRESFTDVCNNNILKLQKAMETATTISVQTYFIYVIKWNVRLKYGCTDISVSESKSKFYFILVCVYAFNFRAESGKTAYATQH